MSVLISPSMCSSLCITKATSSDVAMVQMMIGRDCFPVCSTTFRFSPKPSSTTAACRIFLEVKPMPGLQTVPGVHSKAMIIPRRMEKTGPPMTGTSLPSSHDGMAMERHTAIPGRLFLMVCMMNSSFFQRWPHFWHRNTGISPASL